MTTHQNNKGSNERGALMIEAIALLGLMTMMSPMVVRQTAERTSEMGDATIAGQMKEIKDALANWINANYQHLRTACKDSPCNESILTDANVSNFFTTYLPAPLANGNDFRDNKLMDGYEVRVKSDCFDIPGTSPTRQSCRVTGKILSKGASLSDRQAARIASMIGADGGYVPTDAVDPIEDSSQSRKILGTQGIWEADTSDFTSVTGGQVAAITTYAGDTGMSGDFLYRKAVSGVPDANSMFTDLDMGGNNNGTFSKINNAGGMEVVNGKIVIRTGNDWQANGNYDNPGVLLLSEDKSYIKSKQTIDLEAGSAYQSTKLKMNMGEVSLGTYAMGGGSQVSLNGSSANIAAPGSINMQAGSSIINANNSGIGMNASNFNVNASNDISLTASNDIALNSANSLLLASNEMTLDATDMALTATNDMVLNADKNLNMHAENMNMSASDSMSLQANNVEIGGTGHARLWSNYASLNVSPRTIYMSTSESSGGPAAGAFQNMHGARTEMGTTTPSPTGSNFTITTGNIEGRVRAGAFRETGFQATGDSFQVYVSRNSSDHRGMNMFVGENRFILSHRDGGWGAYQNLAYLESNVVSKNTHQYTEEGLYNGEVSNITETGLVSVRNITKKLNWIGMNGGYHKNWSYNKIYYYEHKEDSTKYTHYRIDPSFTSVMSDIKLTSRGGARLSEALPNYILKGIYELSNGYTAGPWPCMQYSTAGDENEDLYRESACDYFVKRVDGVPALSCEYNKGVCGNCNLDPSTGKCASAADGAFIKVDLRDTKYVEYGSASGGDKASSLSAHPYLGVVPAPGRKLCNDGSGKIPDASGDGCGSDGYIAAQDEGYCPDGYNAVMTLSANTFEMGKVLYLMPDLSDEQGVLTDDPYDMQGTIDGGTYVEPSMVQQGTELYVAQDYVFSSEDPNSAKFLGWKVAAGTRSYIRDLKNSSKGKWVWNFGGIKPGSIQVTAHTYCYYNPSNFIMPNMKIDSNGVIMSRDRQED